MFASSGELICGPEGILFPQEELFSRGKGIVTLGTQWPS